MGTFHSSLVRVDTHKHPAISSSAVLVDREDEDPERLEQFARRNLPASWHMELVTSRTVPNSFYVVLLYGALGSEPSDHNKRWRSLNYRIDVKDTDTWRRKALCDHEQSRNGNCDVDRARCHAGLELILNRFESAPGTFWTYAPKNVQTDGVLEDS